MTVSIAAVRLDVTECRDDIERRFLEVLNERASRRDWHADSWSHLTDHVLVAISYIDGGAVDFDARADFFGERLLLGYDETHQFVTDLDPDDPSVTVLRGSPEELANAAADWFERHLFPT